MKVSQITFLMVLGAALGGGHAAAQSPAGAGYSIKPPDIAVPSDVPLGQYLRSFRPFGNWTLICDENLHAARKVCNVSQWVLDARGQSVFNWSLAAAEGGNTVMVLRASADADVAFGIELKLAGMEKPAKVKFEGCNQNVCLGRIPINGDMARAINRGDFISVTYRCNTGDMRAMQLPLKGLKEAVDSAMPAQNTNTVKKRPKNTT